MGLEKFDFDALSNATNEEVVASMDDCTIDDIAELLKLFNSMGIVAIPFDINELDRVRWNDDLDSLKIVVVDLLMAHLNNPNTSINQGMLKDEGREPWKS